MGYVLFSIPDLLLTDYGDLTPQMLTERGIRLLLCDLDYTLAPKYVPRSGRRGCRAWLAEMAAGGRPGDDPVQQPQSCTGGAVLPGSGHRHMWATRESHRLGATGRPWKKPALRRGDGHAGRQAPHRRFGGQSQWRMGRNGGAGRRAQGAWNHVLHGLQRPFKALCRSRKEAKA